MRTTEMGAWMPPIGRTPDRRRPVRRITLPSIASRRIAFGLPTSPMPSGVIVAAFRPKPWRASASAASRTTALRVARRLSSERSYRSKVIWSPVTAGSSTRSDSSRSSCPVSSPSITTRVFASTAPSLAGGRGGTAGGGGRALPGRGVRERRDVRGDELHGRLVDAGHVVADAIPEAAGDAGPPRRLLHILQRLEELGRQAVLDGHERVGGRHEPAVRRADGLVEGGGLVQRRDRCEGPLRRLAPVGQAERRVGHRAERGDDPL